MENNIEDNSTPTEEVLDRASDQTVVTETTPETKPDESVVDYKAELEKERKRVSQAEHTIMKLKGKAKTTMVDDSEEDEEEYTPPKSTKPFTQAQPDPAGLAALLAQQSSDPDERELILFHFENSVLRSGNNANAILNDLAKAKILANARKYEIESKESKRTVATKSSISNSYMGVNQDRPIADESSKIKLTALEQSLLARKGLTAKDVYNNINKNN